MIRPACPFDPPALALIHQAAFPSDEAWSAAVLAGHLSSPGVFAFIAEAGGMVLARVAADEAEILTLAVAPAARRRGVARALMKAASTHARAAGARRVFLEVAETNTAARALYAALGFAEIARRPAYYPNGADALVLRREIDG